MTVLRGFNTSDRGSESTSSSVLGSRLKWSMCFSLRVGSLGLE